MLLLWDDTNIALSVTGRGEGYSFFYELYWQQGVGRDGHGNRRGSARQSEAIVLLVLEHLVAYFLYIPEKMYFLMTLAFTSFSLLNEHNAIHCSLITSERLPMMTNMQHSVRLDSFALGAILRLLVTG